MVVSVYWSVLEEGEDVDRLDPVPPPQLFQLHNHHTFQDLGLELPQQLTGSKQRPCNKHRSEDPQTGQNWDVPYYRPMTALKIHTGAAKEIGNIFF